jgi:hypothetical protein
MWKKGEFTLHPPTPHTTPHPSSKESEGALFVCFPLLLHISVVFYLTTSTCKPFKVAFLFLFFVPCNERSNLITFFVIK